VLALDDDTTVEMFQRDVADVLPEELDADWTVVAEAPRVVRAFESLDTDAQDAIRPTVREMTTGMAGFVERYADEGGLRIQTLSELEEYCWYVAGTVGELVTELLADDAAPDDAETMREHARSFALLLQLVNVAKDVQPDYYEENNVYLPCGVARRAGTGPGGRGRTGERWTCRNGGATRHRACTRLRRRCTPLAGSDADHARQYARRVVCAVPARRGDDAGTQRAARRRRGGRGREGLSGGGLRAVLERVHGDFDRAALATLRETIENRPSPEADATRCSRERSSRKPGPPSRVR